MALIKKNTESKIVIFTIFSAAKCNCDANITNRFEFILLHKKYTYGTIYSYLY